jgi:hypothetical protein
MNRGRTLLAAGLLVAVVSVWGSGATVAQAQVAPPSYGEGPGAPAGVTRGLPRTGDGSAEHGPHWVLIGLAGASLAGLAVFGARLLAGRRRRGGTTLGAWLAVAAATSTLTIGSLLPPAALAEEVSAQPVAQAAGCAQPGPAERYALTIGDFGSLGAHTTRADATYWGGNGYLFGYGRDNWEDATSNPFGAYLIGGTVLSSDAGGAPGVLQDAVRGWVADSGGGFEQVSVPRVGDEIQVYRRLTTWEAGDQTPMAEVFVAMRYCNVNLHFMMATMPEYDGVAQALRYARLVDARIQG